MRELICQAINTHLSAAREQLESADLVRTRPDLGSELEALRAAILELGAAVEVLADDPRR